MIWYRNYLGLQRCQVVNVEDWHQYIITTCLFIPWPGVAQHYWTMRASTIINNLCHCDYPVLLGFTRQFIIIISASVATGCYPRPDEQLTILISTIQMFALQWWEVSFSIEVLFSWRAAAAELHCQSSEAWTTRKNEVVVWVGEPELPWRYFGTFKLYIFLSGYFFSHRLIMLDQIINV